MRTTMTLDDDVLRGIRERMHERDETLKQTVNDLLRAGLRSSGVDEPHVTPTFSLGVRPGIDLDKALSLAGAMDDEEILRKVELAK